MAEEEDQAEWRLMRDMLIAHPPPPEYGSDVCRARGGHIFVRSRRFEGDRQRFCWTCGEVYEGEHHA